MINFSEDNSVKSKSTEEAKQSSGKITKKQSFPLVRMLFRTLALMNKNTTTPAGVRQIKKVNKKLTTSQITQVNFLILKFIMSKN